MNRLFIAQDYFVPDGMVFDKASGVIDALDDEEYTGSLILLLEEGMSFARRNSKKMWRKESDRRVRISRVSREEYF